MDLLFHRYASPFLLIDQMLLIGRFSDFVAQVDELNADDRLWEFFVNKVEGQTFSEWKASLNTKQNQETTETEIKVTVNESFNILNGFEPITE